MGASRKVAAANEAAPVERPEPMGKERLLPWLVEFSRVNAASLAKGRPGDLPNLIYELRQWLDLEPDEPLNREVGDLERGPPRLQAIIDRVAELLEAVADRKRFRADYSGGGVVLDASKLAFAGGRALSYRDAKLQDAVVRVALDDLYEDTAAALRIQRCQEPECSKVFLAERKNQKYCSHRCANKAASRTYRKAHGKERAARERARYERKVKERAGPSVKVARRPRRKRQP
jgi:hypothetical protein